MNFEDTAHGRKSSNFLPKIRQAKKNQKLAIFLQVFQNVWIQVSSLNCENFKSVHDSALEL